MPRTPPSAAETNSNQPRAFSLPISASACLAAGLLVLTFLLGCFQMWNADIWWHLRTGQLIAERRQVPQTDWYTYTNADGEWIDLHWGFQLAMAGLHAMGGVPLLVLFKAALGALAVGLCLLARRRGWSVEIMVAAWLPALIVLSGRLYVRPEILTLVFLAGYVCVLFYAERRPRLLWVLPAIQVFWVNSQGLFAFGPVVLAFYWLDRLVVTFRSAASSTQRAAAEQTGSTSLRLLTSVTVAVLAACVLNPYAARGALFPLELFRKLSSENEFFRAQIAELRGVTDFVAGLGLGAMANPYFVMHLLALALGAVSFVVLGFYRQLSLFRLLLFVAFSYLGWQATRNNNHFALVAGCVTSWNLAEAWQRRRSLRGDRPAQSGRTAALVRLVLPIVLVSLCVLVVTDRFYDWAGEGRAFGVGERRGWYAHGACRFLGRPGMPERVFAGDFVQASGYIFYNGPQRKVFMDGRLEVNSRETFERYLQILAGMASGGSAWGPLLRPSTLEGKEGSLPAVLLGARDRRSIGALQGILGRPDWRCVYCDNVDLVFLPVDTADRLGLPAADLSPVLRSRDEQIE